MTTAMIRSDQRVVGRGMSFTLPNINKVHNTPNSYTLMLHRSIPPQDMTDPYSSTPRQIRTAQFSSINSAADYMNRSSTRPTTTPAVVGFEGVIFAPTVETPRGIVNGFFPPVKRQGSVCASVSNTDVTRDNTPRHTASHRSNKSNEFAPAPSPSDMGEYHEVRHHHKRSTKKKTKTPADGYMYYHKEAASRSQTQMALEEIVLPNAHQHAKGMTGYSRDNDAQVTHNHILKNSGVDDVSELPRPPKMMMGHRDVPFVYRYKVKKNMSRLSKIMASRPPVKPDHIW